MTLLYVYIISASYISRTWNLKYSCDVTMFHYFILYMPIQSHAMGAFSNGTMQYDRNTKCWEMDNACLHSQSSHTAGHWYCTKCMVQFL